MKTILIEPGQIDTALFAGVETPSPFFAPVLDTREVCKAITGLVDAGEGGVIRLPAYARWAAWYGVLPVLVQRIFRWVSGVDRAMEMAVERKSERVVAGSGDREDVARERKGEKTSEDSTNSGDDMVIVGKM